MAIELKFSKADVSSPWGFRLVGGIDFEQPLVVVKVNENSLAEAAGLQLGDIIVRINNIATAGLTHTEAHDLIHSAGLQFVAAVRRGTFSDLPGFINDELSNAEVCCILSKEIENSRMLQKTPDQVENLTGQENILTSSSNYNPIRGTKQKYSTFLQKPERPKPVPKKVEEERKIIGEPYTVKIVKQKRKFSHERKAKLEPEAAEADDLPCESEESCSIQGVEEISTHDDITEIDGIEESIQMEDGEQKSVKTDEEHDENDNIYARSESPKEEEAQSELVPESSLTLEEQLAAVQKQLLALSQLPSSIQTTLEAVTEQLNKIVSAKVASHEGNESPIKEDEEGTEDSPGEEDPNQSDKDIENDVVSEKSGEISDNEEEASSISENDKKNNTEDEEVPSDAEAPLEDERPMKEEETGPHAGMTEEEKQAKIKEEEQLAKKQKIELLNNAWPWRDQEKPVYRYSRWYITPREANINFLKYTPPPKNLDYLQNSEVYRMVHDMEGPPRGIGSRAEKILPEQDYYQNKGAP